MRNLAIRTVLHQGWLGAGSDCREVARHDRADAVSFCDAEDVAGQNPPYPEVPVARARAVRHHRKSLANLHAGVDPESRRSPSWPGRTTRSTPERGSRTPSAETTRR